MQCTMSLIFHGSRASHNDTDGGGKGGNRFDDAIRLSLWRRCFGRPGGGQEPAWRQGRKSGRDGVDRAAGAAGPHHFHRNVRALLRSEEHTSELQSLMRISYAVFCLKKKKTRIQR